MTSKSQSDAEMLERARAKRDILAHRTPLQRVVRKGELSEVQRLLAQDSDVDVRDDDGFTALHIAVQFDQWQAVELLLNAGADPNAMIKDEIKRYFASYTPLQIAIGQTNLEMVKVLVQHGADVNLPSFDHRGAKTTPLRCAEEAVEGLQALEASNSAVYGYVDEDGLEQPLTYDEMRQMCLDVMEWLIQNGASVDS